jgi:hypothetical protein
MLHDIALTLNIKEVPDFIDLTNKEFKTNIPKDIFSLSSDKTYTSQEQKTIIDHHHELGPGGHPKSPTCGHLKIPHPTVAFKA